MSDKIFPRNLTARAVVMHDGKPAPSGELEIAGNPASTRLESGVANCFPGLEFDQRNLDRRFFPGLVVEYVSQGAGNQGRFGVRVVSVNFGDPELRPPAGSPNAAAAPALRAALANLDAPLAVLRDEAWFVELVSQDGRELSLLSPPGARDAPPPRVLQPGSPPPKEPEPERLPLDGLTAWRLIRSLTPGPVKLQLRRRGETSRTNPTPPARLELTGWRRLFVDPRTGVIPGVFAPGELSQSLCSPWQHDFRDCGCYYWASNHPDIVMAEDTLGEPTLPSGASEDPGRATRRLDWLRSDRRREASAAALGSDAANRPFQLDHYEINQRWQELAIVVEGKETSGLYRGRLADTANPLPSPDALAARLVELATLEHVLILEYLYARYSLFTPEELAKLEPGRPTLADDVEFVRHELLLVAVSEMRHLRWANQLLWELEHAGLTKVRGPSLGIAREVPVGKRLRPRQLRPLTPETLRDFVKVEEPSGGVDGAYAAVLSTLREPAYPPALYQLAARIIADGMEHYSRFRELEAVLRPYQPRDAKPGVRPPYLRKLVLAQTDNAGAKAVLTSYRSLLGYLRAAYAKGDMEDAQNIITARQEMLELDAAAEKLAAKGLGVPFFALDEQPPDAAP